MRWGGRGLNKRRPPGYASKAAAPVMSNDATDNDLEHRRHALLLATVQDFIASAEPVGSRHIVGKYTLGVRAATVRAMMAQLEEQGYLHQPHTSAGRVPTAKAFRYYVDHLTPWRQVGLEERAQIEFSYSERRRDLAETMRETSRLLSLLTGQTGLVMAPRLESVVLERVSFIRLRERRVLALFVPVAGAVRQRVIETEQNYSRDELDRMAAYLNECVNGRTLEAARALVEQLLGEERARYDRMAAAALRLGETLVNTSSPAELYIEGSAKVLEQPEFDDVNKLRELMRALEDKSALLELLERSLRQGELMVSIGSENFDARLSDLSVVAAVYASGSTAVGSVAVLGPVRMDYGRVIPLVDYTARALSRMLEP